jgi:simple sugar transport system permease protein
MLNYVAIKIVAYLQFGPWKDPNSMGYPTMPGFSDNAILPDFLGVNIGWVIAVAALVGVYILITKTKTGFRMNVMGENVQTAKYAGFNTTRLLIIAVVLGGGLCGIAGFIQASAVENSLTYQLSNGWGFTAIIVAFLGKLKPTSVFIVSILMAILLQGCAYIQISLGVPYFMANIIQGVILFFILASDFFSTYQFVWKSGRKGVVER